MNLLLSLGKTEENDEPEHAEKIDLDSLTVHPENNCVPLNPLLHSKSLCLLYIV